MFLHIIFFDTTKYYLHLVNLPWTQPIQLSYNIDAQIDIDPTKTKSRCHQNCFTGSRHVDTCLARVPELPPSNSCHQTANFQTLSARV